MPVIPQHRILTEPPQRIGLPNGFTALLMPRPASVFTAVFAFQAGPITEPEGRSGVSHFLEHCYSLGTARYAPREIDRIIESLGGSRGAYTTHDYTVHYATLPPGALRNLMEIEADRLANLALPQEEVADELDAILDEGYRRYRRSASGALLRTLLATAYDRHPYGKPVTGLEEDLSRLTREDVYEYYKVRYVPPNATLVLTGRFEQEVAAGLVEELFGGLKADVPLPPLPRTEAPQSAERRQTICHPAAAGPRTAMLWKCPPLDHADTVPLLVVEGLISTILNSVHVRHWLYREGGPFTISGSFGEPDAWLTDCDAAIRRIRAQRIKAVELERARRHAHKRMTDGLSSSFELALTIARYQATSSTGWLRLEQCCRELDAVNLEEICRAANRYLRPEQRTLVSLLPESTTPAPA